MQKGRGGMDSHKQAVSGHSGPSPRQKQNLTRNANRELQQAEQNKSKRRSSELKFTSVADAFNIRGKEKR